MAIPRTSLEHELEYGIDLKNRVISFGLPLYKSLDEDQSQTEFNGASVELAVRAIRRMEAERPKTPIKIYMNSYGGEVYSMLYLVDVILSSPCQFQFYGGGAIMSAATWVMSVCDERYLYPNATIMIHNLNDTIGGSLTDIKINTEEAERLMDQLHNIYAENSRMSEKFWRAICSRDTHITAIEALHLGIADFIVEYKKRGNLRKRRTAALSKKVNSRTMKALVNKLFDRIGLSIVGKTEVEVKVPQTDEADPNIVVEKIEDTENTDELNTHNGSSMVAPD